MEMYMAIYKCRLCGKEFCHSGTGDKDTAATATMYTVLESSGITPQFESPNAPTQFEFHSCKDGSYGMGDFLGMSRSRKLRGWKNELPVLRELHTP